MVTPSSLGRPCLEVVGVLLELQPVAWRPRLEAERPGADGLRRDVGDLVLGQDAQLALAEDVLEAGVGDAESEPHGERIDRLDLLDHGDIRARPRAGRRIEDALHGGHDILGRQHLAVVELDALAQLEGPHLEVVGGGPAHGQIRLGGEVAVDAGEPVEDQMDEDVFVADGGLGGIEIVERAAHRHAYRSLPQRRSRETGSESPRQSASDAWQSLRKAVSTLASVRHRCELVYWAATTLICRRCSTGDRTDRAFLRPFERGGFPPPLGRGAERAHREYAKMTSRRSVIPRRRKLP